MQLLKLPFFLLLLVSIGCTTLKTTTMEIIIPAEVEFPIDMKSAVIVNNAPAQPSNYGHKKVIKRLYRNVGQEKIVGRDTVKLDSLGFAVIYNTYNNVQEKLFFDTVIIFDKYLGKGRPFYDTSPLKWKHVQQITNRTNVDVVISLDAFMYESVVAVREYYKGWQEQPSLDVSYEALWRIYDPKSKTILDKVLVKDTVFWDGIIRNSGLYELPTRENAISEAAWLAGEESGKKLIPYSEKVERFYYTGGNSFLKSGRQYLESANYEKAIERWEYLYRTTKKDLLKARVALNLAYLFEKVGDVDTANEWIKKSMAAFPSLTEFNKYEYSYIKQYAKVLSKRKKDLVKVKKQFLG